MGGIESYIKVVDNSGLKKVKCIKILENGKKNTIKSASYFIAAINKGNKKKKFFNKKIGLGLVLSHKKSVRRPAGYSLRAQESRCILLHDKEKTVGNRFKGPVALECKLNNFTKPMHYAKTSL